MRRLILFLFVLSSFIFGLNNSAFAQIDNTICDGISDKSSICKDINSNTNPISGSDGIIMKITKIVAYIVGFASILMIIIAGLKFVTSNGNSESVAGARNTIIYALVGLVVAAMSQTIVRFILNLI